MEMIFAREEAGLRENVRMGRGVEVGSTSACGSR